MRRHAGFLLCALSLVWLAAPAHSATLTLGLEVEFSGGVPPSGTPPWIVATFDDSVGGPNDVRLTMAAPNLTGGAGGESIGLWMFNFDPALDPTQITFTAVSNSASVPNSITTGVNAFQADGDGLYDIKFDFPPPPGSDAARFTGGETVIYDLTYIAPISASSFDFVSLEAAGNGVYKSAAHVMRTGGGEDSGWIGTPEPGTALLLAFGLIGLGYRRR